MKLKDAIKKGLIVKKGTMDIEVDPHRLAIDMFFDKSYELGKDYREQALDLLIKKEINFSSDCNTSMNLMKRVVQVFCPKEDCGTSMTLQGGGGNGDVMSLTYRCPVCGTEVGIPIHNDLSVRFKEVKT